MSKGERIAALIREMITLQSTMASGNTAFNFDPQKHIISLLSLQKKLAEAIDEEKP